MKRLVLFSMFAFLSIGLFAQEFLPAGGGEVLYDNQSNCVSDDERSRINKMLSDNRAELIAKGIIDNQVKSKSKVVSFDWPLRKANGLTFNGYYSTTNFVDLNSSSGLLDYNCGNRTYNGHKGTDIITWPFPWYMYDNDFVEVITAEAGIIISKTDGRADNHCSFIGDWNAIYVEHSDGSIAWYGHMKRNSLTTKKIGDSVSKGEYLGVVASSGYSTTPHLHFEVYDASGKLVDPYSGSCNNLNSTSWWADQRGYRESTLNALLTHNAVPVHGCPGTNEAPNISNVFEKGDILYLATYYQDQLNGDVSNLKIRYPDNSIWQSWTQTSNATYTSSWWYWQIPLPNNGPFGTWKFEVEYNGEIFTHEFDYVSTSTTVTESGKESVISIYPNPTSNIVYIKSASDNTVEITDMQGRVLMMQENVSTVDVSNLPIGPYFITVTAGGEKVVKKLMKI